MSTRSGAVGALSGALLAALALIAQRGACADHFARVRTDVADSSAAPNEIPEFDIARKKGDLSHKLNSTGGVIHPEGSVDPGMQKPAPPVGATPVVPPPGSPGGKQDVQPK